jgi:AraC-like DNA-binding protein
VDLTVDFVEHELTPGAWLWIRIGQVQRFGRGLSAADGTIVLFQPGFLPPHSDLAAKNVAAELGFADPSDFTKFFRLRTGTTPGEFLMRATDRA